MTPSDPQKTIPDASGRFGNFGGQFVPESLMSALTELERAYTTAHHDAAFWAELDGYLQTYVGRPSPLYHAASSANSSAARPFI